MKLTSDHYPILSMAIVALPALMVTLAAHVQGQHNEVRLYWGIFVGAVLTWGVAVALTLLTKESPVSYLLDSSILAMPKNRPLSWEWLTRRLVLVMLACLSAAATSLLRVDLRSYVLLWLAASTVLFVVSMLFSVFGSQRLMKGKTHA